MDRWPNLVGMFETCAFAGLKTCSTAVLGFQLANPRYQSCVQQPGTYTRKITGPLDQCYAICGQQAEAIKAKLAYATSCCSAHTLLVKQAHLKLGLSQVAK